MSRNIEELMRAKELRHNQTEAESLMWYRLRNRQLNNYKFKRQVPIGSFIVDFVCEHKKLIVELDGSQHIECSRYDEKRTQFLSSKGYKVIRFWNNEVLLDTDAVLTVILTELIRQ